MLERQILLSGPSGLGKTTLARIFAAAVNCASPRSGDCCRECESCLMIAAGSHPDVVEVDAASNGGKDEINSIAQRSQLSPLMSRFKIYIIDEAHGITRSGAEAFLKLLEEPPAHVIFVLATTDAHKMLATLRGRCQLFELALPTKAELAANLTRIASSSGWDLPSELASMILAATPANLGVRGTVMTLSKLAPLLALGPVDEEMAADVLGLVSSAQLSDLLAAIDAGDVPAALAALDRLRGRFSEPALKSALLGHTLTTLRTQVSAPALRRLEVLTAAAPTADDVTLAVVTLCIPPQSAGPDRPAQPGSMSPTAKPEQAPAPRPSGRAARPQRPEITERPTSTERPEATARPADSLGKGRPVVPDSTLVEPPAGADEADDAPPRDPWFDDPDSYAVANDDPLAPFWAALISARPRAHDLLAQCSVALASGAVRVIVPPELVERAGNDKFRVAVEQVARESLGLPTRWFRHKIA